MKRRREDVSRNSEHCDESVAEEGHQQDQHITDTQRSHTEQDEIRYVYILNRVLPPEIRVLAWCPVDPKFSARFSCTARTYKYFFPHGNLNLARMHEAASALIGEHDFRNLCKMDVGNGVITYQRHITAVNLSVCSHKSHFCQMTKVSGNLLSDNTVNTYSTQDCAQPNASGKQTSGGVQNADEETGFTDADDGYEMCELTITGQAFLWHQIRCIVAILFLIGQGRESPGIISELLDVQRHPRKPQYTMAVEFPLILFDCVYDSENIEWQYDTDSNGDIVRSLQTAWAQHGIRAAVLTRMLSELCGSERRHQTDALVPGSNARTYKPLFERQLCESLESRIGHYAKKQRLTSSSARNLNVSDAS